MNPARFPHAPDLDPACHGDDARFTHRSRTKPASVGPVLSCSNAVPAVSTRGVRTIYASMLHPLRTVSRAARTFVRIPNRARTLTARTTHAERAIAASAAGEDDISARFTHDPGIVAHENGGFKAGRRSAGSRRDAMSASRLRRGISEKRNSPRSGAATHEFRIPPIPRADRAAMTWRSPADDGRLAFPVELPSASRL